MKINVKKILILITIIGFVNCSKEVETESISLFSEGLFIANSGDITSNLSSSINFYKLGNDDDLSQFKYSDLYSFINGEKIDGTLKDIIIQNSNTYLLVSVSDTSSQIIILDKLTMKKKYSIVLDIGYLKKFLIMNNVAYISSSSSIYAVDLTNGNLIKEFNRDAKKGVGTMIIHNDYLYFATKHPYGKVNRIDLSQNKYAESYNIGLYPNSFIFLEDGTLYMTAEKSVNTNTSAYNTAEFLNPDVKTGILKLNIETNTISQIVESYYAYPKHLSRDGNSFCFIQFEEIHYFSDSSILIWNKLTNTLSPNYKVNFFNRNLTSLILKNSLLYAIGKNDFYLLDIESNSYIRGASVENAVKLVFTE
jgi:hypothetical protein